ncbi:hypothetical protein AB5I41_11130 [Sphingomonas sp. MMS24-JH45]
MSRTWRWDRALSDGTLLKPASLERLWTPFPLASGKPNSMKYGFGWWLDEVNGHRIVEHGGAWQGFASDMARYPDDGLTVVVFANLDAAHARPGHFARVIAGLVSPALMPPLARPLPDDAARLARLRTFLKRAAAGGDMTSDFDPAAGYRFDPLDAGELAAALPKRWKRRP